MNSAQNKSARATFTIPAETLRRFTQSVPARHRSRWIAARMAEEVARQEAALVAACEAANADSELSALERDWQGFDTPVEEPWEDG